MENFSSYREEAKIDLWDLIKKAQYQCTVHKPNENVDCIHVTFKNRVTGVEGCVTQYFPDVEYNPERQYCVKDGVLGSFERKESRQSRSMSELEAELQYIIDMSVAGATMMLNLQVRCRELKETVEAVKFAKHLKRFQREQKSTVPRKETPNEAPTA